MVQASPLGADEAREGVASDGDIWGQGYNNIILGVYFNVRYTSASDAAWI